MHTTDDNAPNTPLNEGSRVHAWVRIAGGTPSGVAAEDAVCVQSDSLEDFLPSVL